MRKLLCFLILLGPFISIGQDSVIREIVLRGIDYHEEGKYDLAIIEYNKALEMDPKDGFANYEMALTHYYKEDLEKAIEYAKVASKEESESGLQAIILLGSVYDQIGQSKRSMKVLEKATKTFGDYYLLWYNIGVTASSQNDLKKAEEAFRMSIGNKLDHSNSHFALGRVLLAQERRVEGIYPLFFFLLLEPKSERSPIVYRSIEQAFSSGVSKENDTTTTITLNVKGDDRSEGLRSAALMMSMLEASRNLEKYDSLSETEADREILRSFLSFMGELEFDDRDDIFTNYYFPFLGAIAKSDHFEQFFHYVRMSMYESSRSYCEENPEELGAFFDWLDTVEWDE